jgi:NAD(P)H dehydrogenase (quinone)
VEGQLEVTTVAIVAHSRAGHTWRLSEAVCDGARIADAQVHLTRINEKGMVDGAGLDMLAAACLARDRLTTV